jgi:hypothetical protein
MVGWIYNNSNKMECKLHLLFFLFYCSEGLELGGWVEGMGGSCGGESTNTIIRFWNLVHGCTRGLLNLLNLLNLVHIHTYHITSWILLGLKVFWGGQGWGGWGLRKDK